MVAAQRQAWLVFEDEAGQALRPPKARTWGPRGRTPVIPILAVLVTAASFSDNAIGTHLLSQAKATHPTITKVWVDSGFKNKFIEHAATLGIDAEVVSRNTEKRGFHIVKRRWVVERSLGWLMLHRRLTRDYETLPASSEAMIHLASIDNLTKRITDETTPTWRGTH